MRTTQTIARILAFTSIALTVYAVISILLNAADARDLGPIFKSIYFQIIGIISYQAYRIDTMNFDVYREDPVAATPSSATL